MLYYGISGLLLFLAQPPMSLSPLAFIALIPLVFAASKAQTYGAAALGGFLTGVAFFLPALFWLTSVTYIGWAALAVYCALYIAAFAALSRFTSNTLTLAAGWVFLEFVRGVIAFTGFPWLLLSHSQYAFTAFTQILDIIGSYGLSGVIAALNVLLWKGVASRRPRTLLVAAAVFATICSRVWGASAKASSG